MADRKGRSAERGDHARTGGGLASGDVEWVVADGRSVDVLVAWRVRYSSSRKESVRRKIFESLVAPSAGGARLKPWFSGALLGTIRRILIRAVQHERDRKTSITQIKR